MQNDSQNAIDLKSTNLVGKNGHHKFSWLESFNHTSNQIAIVGRSNVTFEAYVRKLWFGSYMDCHVASLERVIVKVSKKKYFLIAKSG